MANEYSGAKEFREPGVLVIYQSTTTPADAAFTSTPPNGTMVFCTTDHKLYIREAGVWIKTAALT